MDNSYVDSLFNGLPEDEAALDASGAELVEQFNKDNPEAVVNESAEMSVEPEMAAEESTGFEQQPDAEDDSRVANKGDSVRNVVEGLKQDMGIPEETMEFLLDQVGAILPSFGIADKAVDFTNALVEKIGPKDDKGEALKFESPLDTMQGAALGTAETTMNLAEVAGDTVKTFATLGNVDDSQNVFSDKYDWATWNLGKDDFGAQTGYGKVAQGFLEFGLIGGQLGAFRNFASANTVGGAVKLAGKEALTGVAADMVMAANGEGNMMNLIKENLPGLLPTFLQALAVEEDDNPFEVMIKTAFEGAGLGAGLSGAGSAITAYFKGAKAAKNAEIKGLLPPAQEEAAAKAAAEVFEAEPLKASPEIASPISDDGSIPKALSDAADGALASGNTQRFEALSALIDQKSAGIPYYYDDVAGAFPEYFTAGNRPIEQFADWMTTGAQRVLDLGESVSGLNKGGQAHIIDPTNAAPSAMGNFVAIDGADGFIDDLTAESLGSFVRKNSKLMSREDTFMRISRNNETGGSQLELVRLIPDPIEANQIADMFDQKAIYGADGQISVVRTGQNRLKDTEGAHLKSMANKPKMENTPAPTTTMVADQINANKYPLGPVADSRQALTDNQVKRLAKAEGDEGVAEVLSELNKTNPVELNALSKASQTSPEEILNGSMKYIQDALKLDGRIDLSKLPTMKNEYGDELLTTEGIVAVRGLLQKLSSKVFSEVKQLNSNAEIGADFFNNFRSTKTDLLALMRIHKITANARSRGLSVPYTIEIPKELGGGRIENPTAKGTSENMELGIKKLSDTMDAIEKGLMSGSPTARQEALRFATALQLAGGDATKIIDLGKNISDVIKNGALKMMYNSMLSSPTTHIVNTVSNAINTVARPMTGFLGGSMKQKRQSIAAMHAMTGAMGDAFNLALRTFQTGNDGSIKGAKAVMADSQARQILEDLKASAEASDDMGFKFGVAFAEKLNDFASHPLLEWPSKFLTSADKFFEVMISRMEYSAQTMGKAIDEASATDKPVEKLFDELYKAEYRRSFDSNSNPIDEGLQAAAKEATFQTDLEGTAARFSQLVNDVPVLKVFFPFVKTGHNIMTYTATHVPLLNRLVKERNAVMNGTDEYAKAVMKGREAIGTFTIMTAALAAHNGLITGNGPADAARKKEWLKTNQARSIRIGDKWVDYSKLEPFGQIMSAAADIVYMFNSGQLEEDKAQYLAGQLTYAISMNLTNKSYLQGLVPLGRLLTPGYQGIDAFTQVTGETFNNFIPYSAARRAFANLMQPHMLEFNNSWDRLVYQASAGFATTGAVSHDYLTGEPIEAAGTGMQIFLPTRFVERGRDSVKDTLEDMEFDSTVIMKEMGGIKLTPDHKSRLQYLMGTSGLHGALKKWFATKGFDESVEDFKKGVQNGSIRTPKTRQLFYKETSRIIREYRDIALHQLRMEYPELDQDILAYELESQAAGVGDIDALIQMPK